MLLTSKILEKELSKLFSYPEPAAISREYYGSFDKLKSLLNDPHLWSCVQSRRSGISSEYFSIKTGNNKVLKDTIKMINRISFQKFVDIVIETILYGFSAVEIIWEHKNSKLTPVKLISLPRELITIENEKVLLLKNNTKVEIPSEKLIFLTYQGTSLSPYGTSLLSKCYFPIKIKNAGLKYWIHYTEKYGMPIITGKYERGATQEEADALADALSDMHEDTVLVSPSDVDVDVKQVSSTATTDLYEKLIKHCNSEISKVVLSQTLTTELQTGSYAAANIHYKIREDVINNDKRLLEKFIMELTLKYLKLNYQQTYDISLTLQNDEETKQNRLERDLKLMQTKEISFSKQYWLKNYGFNESDIIIK